LKKKARKNFTVGATVIALETDGRGPMQPRPRGIFGKHPQAEAERDVIGKEGRRLKDQTDNRPRWEARKDRVRRRE